MTVVLKIGSVILALPPALVLSLSLVHGFDSELVCLQLALATTVMFAGALFLRCEDIGDRNVIISSLAGAILLGGLGFAVGYWQPGWFGSHGNLAPLVGVFVTGPIAFLVGALVGFTLGATRAVDRRVTLREREALRATQFQAHHHEAVDELGALTN